MVDDIRTDRSGRGSVLIVDDTPVNIDVLYKYFLDQGFRVFVARDGESALEQAPLARPDIILLDVLMSGIDGYETCRRLKSDPATADTPVIIMTALSEPVDKIRGFEAGGVDYITKPIHHEEVLARVVTHITLRNLQKQLEENNRRLQAEIGVRVSAEQALHEVNATLEARVLERTQALGNANDRLQIEVEERRKTEEALRKALDELEHLKNRLQAENVYLQEELRAEYNFEELVGASQSMRRLFQLIHQVANTDATVMITGETGTGKELVARAIHNVSRRRKSPLIKVHCAALADGVIESELFGHEKGAFTGATARKKGRFELAHSGTLLLDEIGELPLDTQVKLLRILQEQEFERVGGTQSLKVDVRVLAATNRNLEELIEKGLFRQDLFYRLNIFPIIIPPLRDRKDDVPLLVRSFIRHYATRMGKNVNRIDQKALDMLLDYPWPGNVRELNNVIERAIILCPDETLRSEHLAINRVSGPSPENLETLESVERNHILKTLERVRWIIGGPSGAARRLGINRTTLLARMKKLGIERPTP